jgi:predicted porin
MNKKLIAAAVSAAVMAPVASQADVVVYGRIHNGIQLLNPENGESSTDVYSVNSRFGIKASSDLGNGLTAAAKYEFSTTTDKEKEAINDIRVAVVSISGNFGTIGIGNQWSAFYDTVGTHIDPTFTIAYTLYSSFVGNPYRASNTIKYSNSFGPVYMELDVRLNDENGQNEGADVAEPLRGDGAGIGLSWSATDNLVIAAAFDSEDGNESQDTIDQDRTGIAAKWTADRWFAILGWNENENDNVTLDQTQIWAGMNFGENTMAMLGYGGGENDATGLEPTAVSWGVYHNMGGGFKLMWEGTSYDTDAEGDIGDFDRNVFSMRLDF